MHRLSGIDAAFLYGETPSWHMHVSGILIIDPSDAPDFGFDAVRAQIIERLPLVPQLRWTLVEVPFGLDTPRMIEDPDFDIDYHLRHIGLPAPGGREQLGNLVGELVAWKLDRTRPLWEMWMIDGLEDGRVGMLFKIHHAIIDGVSGSELATVLLDLEKDPEPREVEDEREFDTRPGDVELLISGVGHAVSTPYRMARFGRQTVTQLTKFIPIPMPGRSEDPLPMPAVLAPRTPFNAAISPHRRFASSTIPLDDVKRVKDVFGAKINDVVLAVCAGSLRKYLLERGGLPEQPLLAQCPVSMHTEDTKKEVGNQVGTILASLATDIADPVERLGAIHEGMNSAKEMQRAMAAEKIMGIGDMATPGLVALAARMWTRAGLDGSIPPVMNLIISNVPGPPFPLYSAGAVVEAMYPMGPLLMGTGLNITVFSYRDSVDFGFLVCREAIPDPWPLADYIPVAFAELREAAEERESVPSESGPAE